MKITFKSLTSKIFLAFLSFTSKNFIFNNEKVLIPPFRINLKVVFMGFMETLIGAEERVLEMINVLSAVIGFGFMLMALITMFYSGGELRTISYSVLAMAFLLFPMAASKALKKEMYVQSPPPIIKKKR